MTDEQYAKYRAQLPPEQRELADQIHDYHRTSWKYVLEAADERLEQAHRAHEAQRRIA